MRSTVNNYQQSALKRKKFRYAKPVIILAAVLAVVLVVVFILGKKLKPDSAEKITTYQVEEITLGNVSSTVSGSGTLTPVTKKTLTAGQAGEMESVSFHAGDEVSEGETLAVISGSKGEETVTAPCDGILLEVPVKEAEEVEAGDTVAVVMGKDGFTMGIAVDELNISSVELDQEVYFTIEAAEDDYTGTVTEISYDGSSSEGTIAYQITATVGYIEGVYPGMSATAEIVTEDSGEGLVVPVSAVGTSGDDSYVYLAPSGAESGASYEEGELDLNDLTKVTVDTGMSDGTYMMIESEELEEGDLIIVTQVTSALTGSGSEEEEGAFGGMGEFPGGMDFEDFNFEDFDPSQMPQGGGSFPGMGSN